MNIIKEKGGFPGVKVDVFEVLELKRRLLQEAPQSLELHASKRVGRLTFIGLDLAARGGAGRVVSFVRVGIKRGSVFAMRHLFYIHNKYKDVVSSIYRILYTALVKAIHSYTMKSGRIDVRP